MNFDKKINYFNDSCKIENDPSTIIFAETIYKKAFPNFIKRIKNKDKNKQFDGIDCYVYLKNNELKIEEKFSVNFYEDFLLEIMSNDQTKTKGWMEKDLKCDWFAYFFIENKRVYLIKWPILKKIWEENKKNWISKYEIIKAKNENYNTISIAIPIYIITRLLDEIPNSYMYINLKYNGDKLIKKNIKPLF
jgi:hypothetical protein